MRRIILRLKLFWRSLDKKVLGIWTLSFLGINVVTATFATLYIKGTNETTITESTIEEDNSFETIDVDTIGSDPFTEIGLLSNNQDYNESYYAITSEGYLYTWGWNLNGELGLETLDSYVFYPTFVNLDGSFNDVNENGIQDSGEIDTITDGDKIKDIYHINYDHAIDDPGIFAISQEGYLYMWGSTYILPEKNTPEYKYSRSKSSQNMNYYISPTFVNLDESYLQDDAGTDVEEPARDIDGLLYRDDSNNIINVKVPTKTEGDKVKDMEIYATSRDQHGGMILSESGDLHAWGMNKSNVIDQNASTPATEMYEEIIPVIYSSTDTYPPTTYKEISVINNSLNGKREQSLVLALGDDDYLYMWGDTTLIPGTPHLSTPTSQRKKIDLTDSNVSSDTTHSGKVKSFSASRYFASLFLINEDGYLYSIGGGSGNGTAGSGCEAPSPETEKFVRIDINCNRNIDDDKVKYVSNTNYEANLVTEDGYLYTWGRNAQGTTGHGTTGITNKPEIVDINQNGTDGLVGDEGDKVSVVNNGNATTNGAITNSGDLYMWGLNKPSEGYGVLPETIDGAFLSGNNTRPVKVNFVEYEEGEKFTNLEFWHLAGITSTDLLNIYTWGSYNFSEDRTNDNLRNVEKFTVEQFVTPAIALK